ncbi:hypothetical protein CTAM01_17080, partial [Colletotrichum tamarilloi]
MVSQIENRRRVVGDWDFLQLAPATPSQKPTRSHGLSFDGEATVPGQDNAADPPLASSGQQCETDHLGAKAATAGTAGMQGGLEDTFFDRVDSADTIDNQDADSDID